MENSNMPQDLGGDGVDYSSRFITSEYFTTIEKAIEWARQVALDIGFELVISSWTDPNRKVLRCNRGERYRGKGRDLNRAKRKNTRTKSCGCTFQLLADAVITNNVVSFTIVPQPGIKGTHNHPLIVYPEGHRQLSKLTLEIKLLIREYSSSQVKPAAIEAAIHQKFPNQHLTRKQIYNYRSQIRKADFEKRDVVGQFYQLALQNKYVHWTQADEETNVVTHIFMAHPTSTDLFRTYHWYIGIDSTYKTNRYKMPLVEFVGMTPTNKKFLIAYAILKDEKQYSYEWALDKLRILVGDVQPTAFITDRELGLMPAIANLFPNSSHLLCTWHINKDVKNAVWKFCGKVMSIAESFVNGSWKKVMHAATEEQYEDEIREMKDRWSHQPLVLSYLESTWLEKYKEMFIPAWTNRVLHCGNTTNCRVESAHAQLKDWLHSSTGALDTVWVKIDNAIKAQVISIRYSLEQSMNRRCLAFTKFPLNYLGCFVADHCLKLLTSELERMGSLGEEILERCGCALQTTHQIPCACLLFNAKESQTPISINQIHEFWRTLVIQSHAVEPNNNSIPDYASEEKRYFTSLAEEVHRQQPEMIRNISLLIHDQLHPQQASYGEPDVNENVRGRPKGSKSTRRDKSGWEYSEKGSGRKRAHSSSTSQGCNSSMDNATQSGELGVPLREFFYKFQLPTIILPYIERVLNVNSDGNCGFRVFASYLFHDQEEWRSIRNILANEIDNYPEYYNAIYQNESIDEAYSRIKWDGGDCGEEHWMSAVDDFYPLANIFNVAVMYFGCGTTNASTASCFTILPLYAAAAETRPRREIVVSHLWRPEHFVRLNMCPDFPIPPITTFWKDNHHSSVNGWENMYNSRRDAWNALNHTNGV